MLSRFVFLVVAFMGALTASTPAEAAVPIPCTATRFLAATDVPNATDRQGNPIVLRYNVFGCQNGQWDGYSSIDGKYHKLTPELLARLPNAPTFWTAALAHKTRFWVEWLWLVVGAFVVLGTALVTLAGVDMPAGRQAPSHKPAARQRS